MHRETVRKEVIAVIRDILGDENAEFGEDANLTTDLNIISDDLSFVFVPELQDRLGVKLSLKEWREIGTVRDAIDALTEHYKGKLKK